MREAEGRMKDLKWCKVQPLDLTEGMYVEEKYFQKKRNDHGLLKFISKRHIPCDQIIIWFIIHLRDTQCDD